MTKDLIIERPKSLPEIKKSKLGSYRTSSLFHYTKDMDRLQSILKEGIRPNFAKETFLNGELVVGIPMVSFCDIPISRSATIMRYGEYCIGLSKEWGIKNKVNPVLYYFSFAFNTMHEILFQHTQEAKKKLDRCKEKAIEKAQGKTEIINGQYYISDTSSEGFSTFLDHNDLWVTLRQIFGHHKLYYGESNGERTINYEENEWRYLKDDNCSGVWKWNESEYEEWRGDREQEKPTSNFDPLIFDINDVSFIIVKEESEVGAMICFVNNLTQISGRAINEEERHMLLTKIISFERIEKDF